MSHAKKFAELLRTFVVPGHSIPFPVKPALHSQLKEPVVSIHVALSTLQL